MLNTYILFSKQIFYIELINRIKNSNSYFSYFQFSKISRISLRGNTSIYHLYFPAPVLPGQPRLDYIKAWGFNLYYVNDETKSDNNHDSFICIKIITSLFQFI